MGRAHYADKGDLAKGGGGEGEMEDTVAFNIQALVESTLIFFNMCSLERTKFSPPEGVVSAHKLM